MHDVEIGLPSPPPAGTAPPVAALAQLVEHLIRNEGVGGSNPSSGTTKFLNDFKAIIPGGSYESPHVDVSGGGYWGNASPVFDETSAEHYPSNRALRGSLQGSSAIWNACRPFIVRRINGGSSRLASSGVQCASIHGGLAGTIQNGADRLPGQVRRCQPER